MWNYVNVKAKLEHVAFIKTSNFFEFLHIQAKILANPSDIHESNEPRPKADISYKIAGHFELFMTTKAACIWQ